jgi:hypothetical protein
MQLLKTRRIHALAARDWAALPSRLFQEELREVISSKLTRTQETMAGLAEMHDRSVGAWFVASQ